MFDAIQQFLPALGLVVDPLNIALIVLGVLIGTAFGILPGFGGSQALALMFPFTFFMEPASAVMFMLSVYSGAEYGGSIPAILINTPGTSAAIMTLLDGVPMAKKGRPRRALQISNVSGVIGGLLSSVIFFVSASGLAWVGLQFGPSELFAVGLIGLTVVGGFVGNQPIKAFIGCALGLLLSTVGDSTFGGARFTFDVAFLADRIPLIVMIMAFLAAPEALRLMLDALRAGRNYGRKKEEQAEIISIDTGAKDGFSLRDVLKILPASVRGGLVGTAVGALPGPGPTIAAVIAYNEEKRWSRDGARFGEGVDDGIAAPESSNNAVVAGALVPALALGVPGTGAIAILLGVLVSKGIVPGPTLFSEGGPLVMAVFLGLIACNLALLLVGWFGIRFLVPIASIPTKILAPFVFVLLVVGAYAHDNSVVQVWMFLVLGTIAFVFEKVGISPLPIILGFVMGPIIETNLGRALIINRGDVVAAMSHPIAAGLLIATAAIVIYSFITAIKRRV
jgi:putative tricarboxylic transport membrane protein